MNAWSEASQPKSPPATYKNFHSRHSTLITKLLTQFSSSIKSKTNPLPQITCSFKKFESFNKSSNMNLNLSLRNFDLSDVDDYVVWATDPKSAHFCSWDIFKSREAVIKYMVGTVFPHPWFRAICIDNKPVGCVSISTNSNPSDKCRAEIGYVLGSAYWGKGIATRAVKMAVDEAFGKWEEVERIEGLVDVANVGSQKVLEKAGFFKEGVLRKYVVMKGRCVDMVMYSILRKRGNE